MILGWVALIGALYWLWLIAKGYIGWRTIVVCGLVGFTLKSSLCWAGYGYCEPDDFMFSGGVFALDLFAFGLRTALVR